MLGMVRARRIALPHERQIWSGCSRSINPKMPIFRWFRWSKENTNALARDPATIAKLAELLLGMERRVSNFAQTPRR
jgi:hypothetical protein